MSMQGNPHYVRAVNIPEGIEVWDAPDVPAIMAEAVVEATLALAFEQRTANLIALWMDPLEVSERGMYGVNYVQLADQIQERLGLND